MGPRPDRNSVRNTFDRKASKRQRTAEASEGEERRRKVARRADKRPRSTECGSGEGEAGVVLVRQDSSPAYDPRRQQVEEYVPEAVPEWRRREFRAYWADAEQSCGEEEPWGHLARDCRRDDCPFVEVCLPDDDDDESVASLVSRWRMWGHLASECPGGDCGCVPVLLPDEDAASESAAGALLPEEGWW